MAVGQKDVFLIKKPYNLTINYVIQQLGTILKGKYKFKMPHIVSYMNPGWSKNIFIYFYFCKIDLVLAAEKL